MTEFKYVIIDGSGQYHVFAVDKSELKSAVREVKTLATLLDAREVRVDMSGYGVVVYDALQSWNWSGVTIGSQV